MNIPWFQDGLRFQCTGCGKCCTGPDGYVFLSPSDIDRLSLHFELDPKDFLKKYCRFVDGRYALLDKAQSDDCLFLQDKKCSIYEARPTQCRTFPWWVQHLRDEKDWEEASQRCEGINHKDAPLVPALHIEEQCMTYLDNLAGEESHS